jgi:5-methyltetrahydrofolate--homocysteine methyltransferase
MQDGLCLLDGATGSNLRRAGMPLGVCAEQWILQHPDSLKSLQQQYVEAGSQVVYAPTFQAQPFGLQQAGLDKETEKINAQLVALSRSVAGSALVAGDLTTMAAFLDSFDEANFDTMVDAYRRQIRGLIDGGADFLAAETLMYPLEAEAIFTAAELEGAGACIYTFTMQPDGALFSGMDAAPVLKELENTGAAAVGFNCVAANDMLPGLVSKLRRFVKGPLVCKPNAGDPVIDSSGIAQYSMGAEAFAEILLSCKQMGATLLGGCCGTTPAHIAAIKNSL